MGWPVSDGASHARTRQPDPSYTPSTLTPNFALTLWATAGRLPAKAAIDDRDEVASWGTVGAHAAGIARALTEGGLQPGDRVGLWLGRSAASAAAFFGVLAAGGVAIIINDRLRPRQVEHILGHSTARLLLTNTEMLARQNRDLETATQVVNIATMPASGEFTPVPRVGRDYAQIIYTSGSTGLPKGVTWTHANLWAAARAVVHYVEVTERDRLASLLPFSFDYGFNQLLCAALAGATLVIERSPLPEQMAANLRAKGVTVLACVPPLWLQLMGAPDFRREPIATLRAMTNTGGRIPVEGVRELRRLQPHAKLFLMYGLTEAFRGTYLPPDEVDAYPDSIGRAIPGSEIFVLRDDGTPCDNDEVGELVQRGATVAAGYWNDPETTAKVYRPNPLRPAGAPDDERVVYSGDLVRRDAEGRLYYVGRRDRIIKTLGMRVSPDEIVDVLYASGSVAEAIVGTEEDEVRGTRIIAYIVLKHDSTLPAVEAFCRRELPRHMHPARYEVLTELPRTTSGKFDLRSTQELIPVRSPRAQPA
jgi:amino acid adenylation domain-containing protein